MKWEVPPVSILEIDGLLAVNMPREVILGSPLRREHTVTYVDCSAIWKCGDKTVIDSGTCANFEFFIRNRLMLSRHLSRYRLQCSLLRSFGGVYVQALDSGQGIVESDELGSEALVRGPCSLGVV
jgi:hypothetical protein